jgi:hypothetical protein
LAKAGLTKVIEHLYFYQHLCFISADGFQMPCLRQAVSRWQMENKINLKALITSASTDSIFAFGILEISALVVPFWQTCSKLFILN